jgi:hypothetical protein
VHSLANNFAKQAMAANGTRGMPSSGASNQLQSLLPIRQSIEHSAANPTTMLDHQTSSFQTLLAFYANNTYRKLTIWFGMWASHHLGFGPWVLHPLGSLIRNYKLLSRPRPRWNNPARSRPIVPIVQCPKCGYWLTSAWDYSLHVPYNEFVIYYRDGENYYVVPDDTDVEDERDTACWKLQWLLTEVEGYRENHRDGLRYLPAFLSDRLATLAQIHSKEREAYYPVVCSACKLWVTDPCCARLHKTCPAVCWQAKFALGRPPRLRDHSSLNCHVLGLTTLTFDLRPIVYWRHAFAQLIQHKYTIVYHALSLHALAEIGPLPLVHLHILGFLVNPFSNHVYLTKSAAHRKLLALQRIVSMVQYSRHF